MNIENITSDKMSLNYDGKTMQIKVYEDLLKKKDEELDQYKNNWEELKKWLTTNYERYIDALPFNSVLIKMKELEAKKWRKLI